MLKDACLLLIALLFAFPPAECQRTATSLNSLWAFKRAVDTGYTTVNLPHTYNAVDAFDDAPGYYRGKAYYRKALPSRSLDPEREHYLRVYAANQNARVWLNGKEVGAHRGGYTAFTFNLSNHLNYRADTLLIEVDNRHDTTVPPLRGDFNFYGGIYREVELIHVHPTHFTTDFYGATAVFIDPLEVKDEASARLRAWGRVNNFDPARHRLEVILSDREGDVVVRRAASVSGQENGVWEAILQVENPRLWRIEDPYLYQLSCRITEADGGRTLDRVELPYGIRYFAFDPDTGFSLNGAPRKLIGVNRHQDRPGIGNALTQAHHLADMEQIEAIGANFLRTAHYPQDPFILEQCDRRGIVVSMEIPLDHEITPGAAFAENCKQMTLELIDQYYNHPSIVIWAYMNEMGLGKQIGRDSVEMTQVADLARELENLIRSSDPYRYTMIPNHGQFDVYDHYELTRIPMIVGWNLYYGWYAPEFSGFGEFVDHAHQQLPDKPMLITEYGAGADPRITSFDPLRFDFSLDWSLAFHRAHLRQIRARPFIAGSAVWNMFDFGSESRQDAVPHVNNKGLCGFDRTKKPVFYLYRAHLREAPTAAVETLPPFIILPEAGAATVPVSVISSEDSVALYHNGNPLRARAEDYVAPFELTLTPGLHQLWVDGKTTGREIAGYRWDDYWREHRLFRINFGTNFHFAPSDGIGHWYPAGELPAPVLQVNGGETYRPRDRGIGSSTGIALTDDDPVYQTMVRNPESIRLVLPSGKYRLALYLARLNEQQKEQTIQVQGLARPLPALPLHQAYRTSLEVTVEEALRIEFDGEGGPAFLNGLEIIRLD